MMNYASANIQIIENPSIESEYYDKGITHTTDILIILINSLEEIKEIEKKLEDFQKKRIIVFNKVDLLNENEKRKIQSTLQSKKYNFVLISSITGEGIRRIKRKII